MNIERSQLHKTTNTPEDDNGVTNIKLQSLQSPGSMAKTAFYITLLGAASASFMSGAVSVAGGGATTESLIVELAKAFDNPSDILPSNFVLMQLGLLSLMGAATTTQQNRNLTERAERMARRMLNEMGELRNLMAEASRRASNGVVGTTQHEEKIEGPSITHRVQAAFDRIVNGDNGVTHLNQKEYTSSSENATEEMDLIWTSNPYEHLPESQDNGIQNPINNACCQQQSQEEQNANVNTSESPPQPQQPPVMASGCVGAYCRALASARTRVKQILLTQRKNAFHALSLEEQQEISTDFIDACCHDEIETVKEMVLVRQIVDVEGFYVGSDGTETCGLHAAAFHGAGKILRFLCQAIDPTDPTRDGGLCDINLRDANGWTAAHFAAGANGVETMRMLAGNGAVLSTEALNGYTPLQWALRLQNHDVANVLRHELLTDESGQHPWIIAAQPLTAIANRLMSLTPPSHG